MARANLNKSKKVLTFTTTASECIQSVMPEGEKHCTQGLFMLRLFKSQPDKVMNLNNC